MERIDEAVGRILKLKQDLGLFEEDMERPNPELFNSSENRDFALKSAENSLVLLKNDGILPFSDQKLLVTGPTANSLIPLNGGWSHSWQGTNPALENRGIVPTVAEALMARGAQYLSSGEDVENYTSNAQLLSAAKRSDVVVVAFGEWAYCEGVGDLEDLRIHESQRALIKELAAQGATLVGVITAGRPRVIKEVEDYFSALIFAPLPGDFGGQAIANVLYGDHNPSGKLPFTYPRNPSVHITFDHRPADAMSIAAGPSSYDGRPAFGPQYEFGHGLSYTTYAVSAELLNDQVEEELKVRVLVENTGDRAGRETVPVYYEDLVASIVPSVKNLCAYVQVDLQPGERKEVVLTIPRSQFAFVGLENQWVTEPGAMKLKIADQVFDFTLL
jgi:beta-glucosidase